MREGPIKQRTSWPPNHLTYGWPPGPETTISQKRAAPQQALYWAIYLQCICPRTRPLLIADLRLDTWMRKVWFEPTTFLKWKYCNVRVFTTRLSVDPNRHFCTLVSKITALTTAHLWKRRVIFLGTPKTSQGGGVVWLVVWVGMGASREGKKVGALVGGWN